MNKTPGIEIQIALTRMLEIIDDVTSLKTGRRIITKSDPIVH